MAPGPVSMTKRHPPSVHFRGRSRTVVLNLRFTDFDPNGTSLWSLFREAVRCGRAVAVGALGRSFSGRSRLRRER
jgi:hypothetical protein